MITKEYDTQSRDLEERTFSQIQEMERVCIEHITRNIELCEAQLYARDQEFKRVAITIFVCGGFIGAIIAAILLKV